MTGLRNKPIFPICSRTLFTSPLCSCRAKIRLAMVFTASNALLKKMEILIAFLPLHVIIEETLLSGLVDRPHLLENCYANLCYSEHPF